MEDPKPNYMLLDRFLVMMEIQNVPVTICMNKKDLGTEEEIQKFKDAYGGAGYEICCISAQHGDGIAEIQQILKGKTTAVAGPSGVGKSTITNHVQGAVSMETGAISKKLGRGKHTTRHSQLIPIDEDTYIMDTPGFSSLEFRNYTKEQIRDAFIEFKMYPCLYKDCMHTNESECKVKIAVNENNILSTRYENYLKFIERK